MKHFANLGHASDILSHNLEPKKPYTKSMYDDACQREEDDVLHSMDLHI
jgi:hypothetical protein